MLRLRRVRGQPRRPPRGPLGPGIWGHTWPEAIEVAFTARQYAGQWRPSVTAIVGRYALQKRLLPDDGTLDAQTAEAALCADPAFEAALVDALKHWRFDVIDAVVLDDVPDGPTAQAEHVVVDPMITAIRDEAQRNEWPACGAAQPGACP